MNRIEILPTDALIVIDPQYDFCPGGALAVAGGDEILDDINFLSLGFKTKGAPIVISQDWHPDKHESFASVHDAEPLSQREADYGPQTLWPDHCIQGSLGAEFHPEIRGAVLRASLIIRKGTNPKVDSYSAFKENDQKTKTGLTGYLRDKGVKRCIFVGLARNYCVGFSALDAISEGFEAVLLEDLTRAIGDGTDDAMTKKLVEAGVVMVQSQELFPPKHS